MKLTKGAISLFLPQWKGVSAVWLQRNICRTDEIEEWLKPGMIREVYGESGIIWAQLISELLPSSFMWLEKNISP